MASRIANEMPINKAEKPITDDEKIVVDAEYTNPSAAKKSILNHALDADEALKAFIGHEGEHLVLDEETNRRLLRKIDWHIMPVRTSDS